MIYSTPNGKIKTDDGQSYWPIEAYNRPSEIPQQVRDYFSSEPIGGVDIPPAGIEPPTLAPPIESYGGAPSPATGSSYAPMSGLEGYGALTDSGFSSVPPGSFDASAVNFNPASNWSLDSPMNQWIGDNVQSVPNYSAGGGWIEPASGGDMSKGGTAIQDFGGDLSLGQDLNASPSDLGYGSRPADLTSIGNNFNQSQWDTGMWGYDANGDWVNFGSGSGGSAPQSGLPGTVGFGAPSYGGANNQSVFNPAVGGFDSGGQWHDAPGTFSPGIGETLAHSDLGGPNYSSFGKFPNAVSDAGKTQLGAVAGGLGSFDPETGFVSRGGLASLNLSQGAPGQPGA